MPIATAMTIANQRQLFDLPGDMTYLNCASISPQLNCVTAAGVDAVNKKSRPWRLDDAWFAPADRLRALAARLFNSSEDDVALVSSVSYGTAVAAANVTINVGQNIVVLDEQFPSNYYVWSELANHRGGRLCTVARDGADSWTEPLLDAIDDNTAIVAAPQCHWTDGRLVDLVAIGRRCREVGAALVIDATQTYCAYPFDVQAIQPDFVVSAGYKWQLGAHGLGYLYVAPKHHHGQPLEHSWFARANAKQFGALVEYTDDFRPGARRFDMGESSNFVFAPMGIAALSQVLEWGVVNIQKTLAQWTATLGERAAALGIEVIAPEHRVGHISGLRLGAGIAEQLKARLANADIRVALRGSALRVSPYLYNDTDDLDRLVEVIEQTIA